MPFQYFFQTNHIFFLIFSCNLAILHVNGEYCKIQDGSLANDDSCTCGETGAFCTQDTGLHCYGSESKCSGAVCLIQDGTAANTEPCKCKTVSCTVETGFICYATTGEGSCRSTVPGKFGFVTVVGITNQCNDADEDEPNRGFMTDINVCRDIGTQIGLTRGFDDLGYDQTSNNDDNLQPPGCNVDTEDSLKFLVARPELPLTCSGRYTKYCICALAPDCIETDGLTPNKDECLCPVDAQFQQAQGLGRNLCTQATGLVCQGSNGVCSAPPCKVTTNIFRTDLETNITKMETKIDELKADGQATDAEMKEANTALETFEERLKNLQEPFVPVPVSCMCGTADKAEKCYSGSSCDSAKNTCTIPLCTIINGSALNRYSCMCGNVHCSEDNGLICYSNGIAPGSCRKHIFGEFGNSVSNG